MKLNIETHLVEKTVIAWLYLPIIYKELMQPELPKTIDRENLLKFIISIRENAELSETEMAKLAGVAKDTIRDFERGKSQMFRADKLQKLLNAVGYELRITRL